MLDLDIEVEATLRKLAANEGVSENEYVAQLLRTARRNQAPADGADRVKNLLSQWQKEYGLPVRPDGRKHTSLAQLAAEWAAEDAELTEKQREADRQFWETRESERDARPFSI